ncbi:MAG: hypothetical protein JWR83_1955 [Aeromicrobium sp.]|nr:hypothetical protein [Aeromicrobium sp.]
MGVVLTQLAQADPNAPAVTVGDQTTSRIELERRANRLAHDFLGRGVVEGDRITLALPNSVDFYVACFAAWKVGATPQPVSWRLPPIEREQIIELALPKVVLGADGPPVADRHYLPIGYEPAPDVSDAPLPPAVAPAWKAMTSGGSTGRPKLIVTREASMWTPTRAPFQMRPDHVQLVAGPLYHTGPFTSMYGALLGQHLIVLPRFDAEAALLAIARHRITFIHVVPTMLHRMARLIDADPSAYDLSSLELVWHGGAPCAEWLKDRWIELVGPERLYEVYAGSEGIAGAIISGTEWLAHRGSVGRPVGGDVKICDEGGQEVEPGVTGQIYMRRAGGAPAPYRYVGASAETLPGGWETFGDLGSIDADGYLYLADRRADLIISGGANVYPAEVEAAICEHPKVLSAAVVGLPDDDLGQRVHAVVQAIDLPPEILLAYLAERLVRYKIPRSLHFVDAPLRDDAGKVRRSALRDTELTRLATA